MPVLDHVVFLLPVTVLEALPSWLTDNFSVLNGGQHADRRTKNKLVLFQDGVYLELIAFAGEIDDKKRATHRWGRRPEGHIIDWALSLLQTTPGDHSQTDAEFATIQKRVLDANVGLTYADLVSGGRITPDGVVLEWATASPVGTESNTGGSLPFWCLDRTPRARRVPYATEELARHPSSVTGVAGLTLHVRDGALREQLRKVYEAVLDTPAEIVDSRYAWSLEVPEPRVHAEASQPQLQLAILDGHDKGNIDGWISLSLFTTGPPKTISGTLVDGWNIDIQLRSI